MLSIHYRIPQISTGDILRAETLQISELGRTVSGYMVQGLLVPDDLMIAIARKRLAENDCARGFILDGFPRTIGQARSLQENGISIDDVIYLDVSDNVLLKRLTGRRICPGCSRMYHMQFNPPETDEICDDCGIALITRDDDGERIVRKRIGIFHEMTFPLIDHFKKLSGVRFHSINGFLADAGSPQEVFRQIRSDLETAGS